MYCFQDSKPGKDTELLMHLFNKLLFKWKKKREHKNALIFSFSLKRIPSNISNATTEIEWLFSRMGEGVLARRGSVCRTDSEAGRTQREQRIIFLSHWKNIIAIQSRDDCNVLSLETDTFRIVFVGNEELSWDDGRQDDDIMTEEPGKAACCCQPPLDLSFTKGSETNFRKLTDNHHRPTHLASLSSRRWSKTTGMIRGD